MVTQENNQRTTPFTICVDFDGCLSLDARYPDIGRPNKPLFKYLINEQKEKGSKIILWTCREYDSHLSEAVDFCKDNGLVFDAINENIAEFNPRKIVADLYIDDHAVSSTSLSQYLNYIDNILDDNILDLE